VHHGSVVDQWIDDEGQDWAKAVVLTAGAIKGLLRTHGRS